MTQTKQNTRKCSVCNTTICEHYCQGVPHHYCYGIGGVIVGRFQKNCDACDKKRDAPSDYLKGYGCPCGSGTREEVCRDNYPHVDNTDEQDNRVFQNSTPCVEEVTYLSDEDLMAPLTKIVNKFIDDVEQIPELANYLNWDELAKYDYIKKPEVVKDVQHIKNQAVKYDDGKPRYDLIPSLPLEELAKVYTVGAQKYADNNWRLGMRWGRVFAGIMRHLWAFWRGEMLNPGPGPETGLHHLAQAAWGCFTLIEYSMMKGYEKDDDRFRKTGVLQVPEPTQSHSSADGDAT